MQSSFFGECKKLKAAELAEIIGAGVIGDGDIEIKGVAPLKNASSNQLSFLSNTKYLADLKSTKAGVCILSEEHKADCPKNTAMLIHKNPYFAYAKALEVLFDDDAYHATKLNLPDPQIGPNSTVEPTAIVKNGAAIGDNCYIGAGSFIGHGVIIGNNTKIDSNVTITHAIIGNNCAIHSGARIGQEGFGFAHESAAIIKVRQLGRVVIGNDVRIGANTCIDRGAIEDTTIGDHTKIDNLVQIGHNVQIGMYCILVAQVAIAGSTIIGPGTMIGGQAGIAGHLEIGAQAKIAAQSGVMRKVMPKQVVGGSPAVPITLWHRQNAILHNMAKGKKSKNDNG